MPARPIRLLIVDDSALMRDLLSALVSRDPEIEVVGTAADPFAAREAIKRLNPDVLTLDVEMPGMNGISFLEKLMALRPMPVVMVSTLTKAGAFATLRALEIGAVEAVAKPARATDLAIIAVELTDKIKIAAAANVGANALSALALQMEIAAKEGTLEPVRANLDALQSAFDAFLAAVHANPFSPE